MTPARSFLCAASLAFSLACDGQHSPGIEPTPAVAELQVCAKGPTVEGIDVSVYQAAIDWPAVRASGIEFAVARISNGLDRRDTYFDANWPAMKAAALVRGAYQYFQPGQDAAAQADLVIEKVGRLGPGELPIQLDMEVTGGRPVAEIRSQIAVWIERVTAGTGKRPIIYTGKFFWDDNVASTEWNTHPLWVANYGVTCPNLPNAWSTWTIWQYTSTGAVPGVGGNVDRDRFNGTLEELSRFASGGPLPDAAPVTDPPDPDPAQRDAASSGSDASSVEASTPDPRPLDAGEPDVLSPDGAGAAIDGHNDSPPGQVGGCAVARGGSPSALPLVLLLALAAPRGGSRRPSGARTARPSLSR
jgi:GH25 family lysozyme M1 (1,4-beta-N-acetylmuramidase)